jgi:hypothetical protein
MKDTINEMFHKLLSKLLEMPKYNPTHNSNKKISERDFHIAFVSLVVQEDSGIETDEWSPLQEKLSRIFLKKEGVTVGELL